MSSDKSKKVDRNRLKPSHQTAIKDDRFRKNRILRELKNLKAKPNDKACLGRLASYIHNNEIPVGRMADGSAYSDTVRKVVTGG